MSAVREAAAGNLMVAEFDVVASVSTFVKKKKTHPFLNKI
jgi:hypothetical protein